MKLLIDIGNSRTKAVLFDGANLTPVEYSLELFDQYPVTQVTYASVGHFEVANKLSQKAKQLNIKVVEATTTAEAFGVKCAYEKYVTLGIDRWLAVLGAAKQYPNQNIIVVDAGTAITIDFVAEGNIHCGGWIVPGLTLMTTSIVEKAEKVFDDSTGYQFGFGQNTPAALKAGCLAAQLGLIHQAVQFFNRDAILLIAGGTAELMLDHLRELNPVHDPLIVFKGLNRF